MAYTAADLANLKRAKATGALKNRFADGREVTFRSLAELDRIIADVKGEVLGSDSRRVRRRIAAYNSGL